VWGYIGWGLLIPSLYDRTLWIPMCLAAICWLAADDQDGTSAATPAAAATTEPPKTMVRN
jgi:hypothetical protein